MRILALSEASQYSVLIRDVVRRVHAGVDCTFVTRYSVKKKVGVKNEAVTALKEACSRRSDSGERCEVKRSAKK